MTDTLRLVVELLRRVEVIDSDIVDCFHILVDVCGSQFIVSRKRLNINIVELICILRVLDISFEVLTFLVDFVRRYYKVLNQHSCPCPDKTNHNHDNRNRKQALVFFSSHLNDEHNR